jgi:spore maturation protein SpmA
LTKTSNLALHWVIVFFFLAAAAVALFRLLGYIFREFFIQFGWQFGIADLEIFSAIMQSTFDMAETSVKISIYLIGIMALWMGIMRIGELGGAVRLISAVVAPFFCKIFPSLPANHPAMGAMMMNLSANMLGLDNAATPLGLKAMNELQELNPEKDRATNAQIMFLVLNTSGLTIIPVSVIALRASAGAAQPTDVFIPILIATYFSTLVGLIAVSIYQRINLFQPTILLTLTGLTSIIIGFTVWMSQMPPHQISTLSGVGANLLIFSIIVSFIILALRNRINVYDAFIEGAKGGFDMAVRIIPYLVAMLVAIGVFRASGGLDMLVDMVSKTISWMGMDTSFIDALPTAFMKPLSGSGARGMMVETMTTFGADSFAGRLASVFQGSTETTFYTLAVYYGAVAVKRTRYTLTCGLIADAAGIAAAIIVSYLFFN